MLIPWSDTDLSPADCACVKSCFDRNWISQGPQVVELEKQVAALAQRAHCLAVSSGTAALTAALLALRVQAGDEVVIPAMSFIAVPHAILLLGATPVLADIDPVTGWITAASVRACLSPRTKAVIGIDYAGFAADWDAVHVSCRVRGVPLIVDAASSFLATAAGRPAGSSGDLAVFSFHSAKSITTGEGGAVVTDNAEWAEALSRIRNHGEVPKQKYRYDRLGSNFRMTDLAASLGLAQLRRWPEILEITSPFVGGRCWSSIPLACPADCSVSCYTHAGPPPVSDLWRLLDQHFETFQQVYDERFAAQYGGVPARGSRPIVERSLKAFLKCGDLHEGVARVRCPDCRQAVVLVPLSVVRCSPRPANDN